MMFVFGWGHTLLQGPKSLFLFFKAVLIRRGVLTLI